MIILCYLKHLKSKWEILVISWVQNIALIELGKLGPFLFIVCLLLCPFFITAEN